MTKTLTSRSIHKLPVGTKGVVDTSTLGHSVFCHEMLFLVSVTDTRTPAASTQYPPAQRAAHSLSPGAHSNHSLPLETLFSPLSLPLTPSLAPLFLFLSAPVLLRFSPGQTAFQRRTSAPEASAADQSTLNRNTKDRRAQRAITWHRNRNIPVWYGSFTLLIEGKLHVKSIDFTFKLRWSKTYKRHVPITKEKSWHKFLTSSIKIHNFFSYLIGGKKTFYNINTY